MPNENKRFYWLKLKRDFFKRHDIRIIEEMPNGKDYILFYLKLLLESIDHDGNLRFSETIPYNENMLSVITNTNIDIVKSAMKIFTELKMIEILDDSTIYMNEVNKLIGSETSVAERVRRHRENTKMLQCNTNVTKCNTDIDIDKDIELDIELDIDKELYKEKENYYKGEIKKEATPFSQNLVLRLYQYSYVVEMNDYDKYVDIIETLADEYDKKMIENKINEMLENSQFKNIPYNERINYLESLLKDDSESLPF